MPTLETELTKIAALACIGMNNDSAKLLAHDVGAIMDFVEQLRAVNTAGVAPMLHPLDLHQRLRSDEAVDENQVSHLAEMAPLFANELYLVPKVIEAGN